MWEGKNQSQRLCRTITHFTLNHYIKNILVNPGCLKANKWLAVFGQNDFVGAGECPIHQNTKHHLDHVSLQIAAFYDTKYCKKLIL